MVNSNHMYIYLKDHFDMTRNGTDRSRGPFHGVAIDGIIEPNESSSLPSIVQVSQTNHRVCPVLFAAQLLVRSVFPRRNFLS